MRDYFLLSDYENERINFNDFLKELLNNKNKKIRKKVFNLTHQMTKDLFEKVQTTEGNEIQNLKKILQTVCELSSVPIFKSYLLFNDYQKILFEIIAFYEGDL